MMPNIPVLALAALRKAFVRTRSVRRLRRPVETIVAVLMPTERGPTY